MQMECHQRIMDFQKTKTDAEATLTEYKTVETSSCIRIPKDTRRRVCAPLSPRIYRARDSRYTHTDTQTVLGKEPIWVKGFHQDVEPIYTQTSANEIIQYKYCCIRNNRLRENLLERREKASVWGACEVIRIYIYNTYTRRACVYRITGDVEGWR